MNQTKAIIASVIVILVSLIGIVTLQFIKKDSSNIDTNIGTNTDNNTEGGVQVDESGTGYFLKEINDKEIVTNANRPDVVAIGSNLYFAYNEGGTFGGNGFKLITLNKDLSVVKASTSLVPKKELTVTDIRVASDSQSNFWYAYESVKGPPGCGNHAVNVALYEQSMDLKVDKRNLSTGCTSGPARLQIPAEQIKENMQIADDPTPFFYNNKYYILNRAWSGSLQHMRAYDASFKELEYFTLDISKIFDKNAIFSQNSLVKIEDNVYVVAGISNNPPSMQDSHSSVYAIPLSVDLKSFKGQPIRLTNFSGEYNTRVTSSYYKDGVLYINYHDLKGGTQYLEAFDTKSNFKSYGRAMLQNGLVGDGHSSFAVIGNKMYLFYNKSEGKINAKVFEMGVPGGKIQINTTVSSGSAQIDQPASPTSSGQINPQEAPQLPPVNNKCGNGICEETERRTGFCKLDCK